MIAKQSAEKWMDCDAPRLGAALAYYTLLSVAPLTILMVAICGVVFDKTIAERGLLDQVGNLLGPEEAATVKMLLDNTHHKGSGIVASITAVATLFLGASGMFVELRNALNVIWGVPRPLAGSIWTLITERVSSFLMVLGLAFLLLISLLMTTATTLFESYFSEALPLHAGRWEEIVNLSVSLFAIATLCALIFRYVPDAKIAARDVGVGAMVTAVLFSAGKLLLAFYIGTAGIRSTYGAAGSVIAFVVWVYYSAQIFLFGATFTRVYADTVGTHAVREGMPK